MWGRSPGKDEHFWEEDKQTKWQTHGKILWRWISKEKRCSYRIFQDSIQRDSIKTQDESARELLSVIRTDRDDRVLDQIYSPYSQTNGTQRMCEEVRHSHPKDDPMLGRQHEHSLSMDSSYTRTIFTKTLEISFWLIVYYIAWKFQTKLLLHVNFASYYKCSSYWIVRSYALC